MRTWAKGSRTAVLAVSLVALGAGPAMSGTAHADTSGDGSIGGGNQVNLPVSIPIDVSGNAVGVAGSSSASSKGGASVTNKGGGSGNKTSGDNSVLGGNQVDAPISAPINACGNAISVFGSSDASCKGGAEVKNKGGTGGGNSTSGDYSVLGGNQIVAPISAPINACGNAVSIFGESSAGCKGGAKVANKGGSGSGNKTSGKGSVGGGNQVVAPISAPINVCGNAVAVVGEAFAGCKGGAKVENGGGGDGYGKKHGKKHGKGSGNKTSGQSSVLGGNQAIAPISAPVNVCGNGNAPNLGCEGGAKVKNSGGNAGGNSTSGKGSVLGGNQVVAPISAPINVCGNAVAVAGEAFAGCKGGAKVKNTGGKGSGNKTSGQSSVLGGNQVDAPIAAPINVCGNAAAVLGTSEADCKGGAKVKQHGSGSDGNTTSGKHSGGGGNQVDAPIAAPINVCGNAAAVLGDAVAGCLGGSKVGESHDGYGQSHSKSQQASHKKQSGGLLSDLPVAPGLPELPVMGTLPVTDGLTGAAKAPLAKAKPQPAPGLPVVGELPVAGSLPVNALPVDALPVDALPAKKATKRAPKAPKKPAAPAPAGLLPAPADDIAETVTDSAKGVPAVGSAADLAEQAANGLPVSAPTLMSAEQPVGVKGMNIASLAVLTLGFLLAGAVALYGPARRFRSARR